MAIFKYNNTAQSSISTSNLTLGSDTLIVSDGDEFPSEFPYRLTIWNFEVYSSPDDDPNMEIVEVTGRTVDTLTITRAKESTSDVEHLIGHKVAQLITAGTFDRIQDEFDVTNGNLSTHESDTTTHGTTGDIVGTTDVQTLEGKTFVTPEVDVINESTTEAGVTVDEVLLKNGTVDGRDVSVDGSKLDGIETGAKDDQTATEIVTLINASSDIIDDDNIASTIARDSEVTSAVGTHAGLTVTHGTSGDIVGTSDIQTLTNKTIDADVNTVSNIDNSGIKASAGIIESKLTLDNSTVSLKSSITAIENDIDYPTIVKQKFIVGSAEDGGVEGGVFNGDFEYGEGSRSGSGWIGDELFKWYFQLAVAAASAEFDKSVSLKGTASIKLSCTDVTGVGFCTQGRPSDGHLIPVIPSTLYRLCGFIKTDNVAVDAAFIRAYEYDSDEAIGSSHSSTKLSGTNEWTYVETIFTTDADAAYLQINLQNNIAGNISDAWFDDIKLEQIDTQVVNTQVVTPASVSIEGVTTTDNITYENTGLGAGGTPVGTTVTEERAIDLYVFDENISGVSFYRDSIIGTFTGDVTFEIYETTSETGDITGDVLSSYTILNADYLALSVGFEFVNLPCKLDTTKYYALVVSTSTQDDINYINVGSDEFAGSVRDRIYNGSVWLDSSRMSAVKLHFAKHTESPVISANGSSLDLTGVKLLTGAKVTVNADGSGRYVYSNSFLSADASSNTSDVHDALGFIGSDGDMMFILDVMYCRRKNTELNPVFKFDTKYPIDALKLVLTSSSISGTNDLLNMQMSVDGINYTTIMTWDYNAGDTDSTESIYTDLANGCSTFYVKCESPSGEHVAVDYLSVEAILDCQAELPILVPSSEVSSETYDLVLNPIDISEGQLMQLKYDLTGWGSHTITMVTDEATWEAQAVSANTIYLFDSNGTTPWTWDERNGLVPPADRTAGAVMAKFLVGDNQIRSSVNDGSMKANVNLSWNEESLRAAINRLTEIANLQYPIVVEVDDEPEIDIQLEVTGATANTGYTNDIISLRQTTAGVAAIAYTGLNPRESKFSEWLDVIIECDDGDGILQGNLYTSDGTLVETYADIMTNGVLSISNPEYKYSNQRLVLQISESTATTSTAWSVTNVKWRYQYNG